MAIIRINATHSGYIEQVDNVKKSGRIQSSWGTTNSRAGYCFFGSPIIDMPGVESVRLFINKESGYSGSGGTYYLAHYAAKETVNTILYNTSRTDIKTIYNQVEPSGYKSHIVTKKIAENGLVIFPQFDGSASSINYFGTDSANIPYIELDVPDATIANLIVNQNDTDINILASFEATNNNYFEFQVLQGGTVVYSASGSTALGVTIPYNTLSSGITTFRARTGNGITSNIIWANWIEITETLTKKIPTVTTLEPDSVNQNLNSQIIVSWASTNQSTYKLTLDGVIYTGTTAKTLTIPPNTLTSGTKTMTLEVTYIPVWATSTSDHRKVTKTVIFLAYGSPPTPTLLNKAIINTATPLVKWDSSEQVAYELKLLDGMSNVVATGEILSTAKQYQVAVALENNKSYNIKLKVKNQYGLWSEYATSTFTTNFVVPNTPVISGFANVANGSIVLNVSTATSPEYKNTEIWRKEPYGEWVRMAYKLSELDTWVDNYVKGNVVYQYKARSIGQTGGIAESDPIELITTVKGYNFYNLEDLNSNITFKHNAEVVPTFNRNEALTMYAGCLAPSYETDNTMYQTLSMTFATKTPTDIDKFLSLIKSTKVFLYKDLKGRKVFGMITGSFSPKLDDFNVTTISFAFTELSFLEQDVYAGDNTGLKLLMWDGTWMFDGTYAFGGA